MSETPSTVAELVRDAIVDSFTRLVVNAAVIAITDDPEAVHQARVATRRMRSDLRTFGDWLDEERATELRGELRWLGGELGAVRDLDVLRDRLRGHAAALPAPDAEVAEPVIRRLDADRSAALRELVTGLGDARYDVLVQDLESAARQPPCTSAAYDAPATSVAPAVQHRWRKLRHAVDQLGDRPADEALHHVRIRAKRCRYAAEACIPAVGKPAKRFAKAVEEVQEVLGEQHDAVVASAWLAKTALECSPAEAYAVGMLAEVERAASESARAAFPPAWKEARRPRLRKWL